MSDQHANQLRKHIFAVSICKIHRLNTNPTSVTAPSVISCPYPGRSVCMRKDQTLCLFIIYIFLYR